MFLKHFITVTLSLVLCSVGFAEDMSRPSKNKTAMDQGRTWSDTELTRTIRERIVADTSLSMRAKNIAIISKNGQVTLKGSVATNQEQSRVEEIARHAAGARSVDNQTQVSIK